MKRALFIGRFQPFHNAHLVDVGEILKEAGEIIIAIGSSQEKNTLENPFSYSERKQMISKALKSRNIKNFRIFPVPDLYNDKKWVEHIKGSLPKFDAVYSGNQWTIKCFSRHNLKVRKIRLIRGISSTIIRNMMIKNKNWQKFVPKEVADYINKMDGADRVQIYAKK